MVKLSLGEIVCHQNDFEKMKSVKQLFKTFDKLEDWIWEHESGYSKFCVGVGGVGGFFAGKHIIQTEDEEQRKKLHRTGYHGQPEQSVLNPQTDVIVRGVAHTFMTAWGAGIGWCIGISVASWAPWAILITTATSPIFGYHWYHRDHREHRDQRDQQRMAYRGKDF